MKTFYKRLFSSVILLGLLAFLLVGPEPYAKYVFYVSVVFFSYCAVWEFGGILLKSGHSFSRKSTAAMVSVTVLIQAFQEKFTIVMLFIPIVTVIHFWTRFLTSKNEDCKMRSILASAAAYFMFSIPFCCIVAVYQRDTTCGHIIFLYLLLVTKIGDIAAYVTGSLSNYFMRNRGGNHKMIPSISPGKSYEGAVGGLVFTLLLSWILWPFCKLETSIDPTFFSIILGLALFFGCMGGDLSESAFKRTCKIKDSGTVLPGIGGVLDLVDSLLVTAPLFLLFIMICTDFRPF